ncbi:glycoside hydrolase family 3 C-terminal domain-containing protein [Catenovulum sp. SX2]|uniref:glycoside hydrolase family 3 C-terminal domain-containing protein n=1 Tax=Catenovulum sp. SX2 TaxID=3398614 RepID=UPI003F82D290
MKSILNKTAVYLAGGLLTLSCTTVPTNNTEVGLEQRGAQHQRQNIEQQIESLLAQMTLEEKISLTHANSKFSIASIERLGIHEMWMSDGPHGVRHEINRHNWGSAEWTDDHSTYLPNLTAVAASWNKEMAKLHGDVLGAEARHRDKDVILGPGVNLARLPLYGRNFEYMGEDPLLAGKLAAAEIKAIQANDVAATVKHYALNTQELNRIAVDAKPDERTLREIYLPAFEYAVKEGEVMAVMGAYNRYMGTNANQSKHLVKDILKGEWGFDGVLLTDWNVDINSFDAAINGLDIEMGTDVASYDDYFLAKPLQKLIVDGKVPMSVLDDKVRRILRIQLRMGMMDKHRLSGERNTIKHQQAARRIAQEGIVLLKNNNDVLPLDKNKIRNVLVMGPNADKLHAMGGGSSQVKALYEISPLQGLKAALGDNVNITVMRAKSSEISPIPGDFVMSRHWTGTPAWSVNRYKNKQMTEKWVDELSYPESAYQSPQGIDNETVVMQAQIKPLATGKHHFKLKLQGSAKLKLDGKSIINADSNNEKLFSETVNLTANQTYQVEVIYQGNQSFVIGWDAPGLEFTPENEYLAAAKQADAVIYFGGLSHDDDREAIDRTDMALPGSQDEIISKLLAANQNTVVFMIAGSAVEMPWAEQANAIVWGWYAGMEAGNAFADVLVGKTNPSGKMPITLPAKIADTPAIALNDYNEHDSYYKEGVFMGYRWFEAKNIQPLFAFGHGLSYTSFEYSDIKLSTDKLTSDEQLTVTCTITNTGKVAGAEVVQLYVQDSEASVARPIKELKGFAKVMLQPNQSETVTFSLNKRDLSFWDVNTGDWLAESGEFKVMLAAAADDIRLQQAFTYQAK